MQFVFNQMPQVDFSEIYTICLNHIECLNCPVKQNKGLTTKDNIIQKCHQVIIDTMKEQQNGNS